MFSTISGSYFKIIDKNLEMHIDIKQLNKVFPNCIQEFSVALTNDYEKNKNYFRKKIHKKWILSRKYDGVRCIVISKDGQVRAHSRNGHHLVALKPLEDMLAYSVMEDFVLDGEICSLDEQGQELFHVAVSEVKCKSKCMTNYRYYVFDHLTPEEFRNKKSKNNLVDRIKTLDKFAKKVGDFGHLRLFEYTIWSEDKFIEWQNRAEQERLEGLIF